MGKKEEREREREMKDHSVAYPQDSSTVSMRLCCRLSDFSPHAHLASIKQTEITADEHNVSNFPSREGGTKPSRRNMSPERACL